MKVRAKHNINLSGTWHMSGDVFEISTTDMSELSDMVELAETPLREETKAEEPTKRSTGRKKKTETQ